MENELKKLNSENEDQYIWRVGQYVDQGKYNWNDIKDIISKEIGLREEEYRTESAYRKRYQNYRRAFDNIFSKLNIKNEDDILGNIDDKILNLKIERSKIRGQKVELNRLINSVGRDEAIIEEIKEEIKKIPKLELPNRLSTYKKNEKEYVLIFSDTHYGASFTVKGLLGEELNKYNPDIFEDRMWRLLDWVKKEIEYNEIQTLNVYDLGDQIDGILRISQLQKLKYGIIESTIRYSNFICTWLNELTKYVNVKFQCVCGNHSELRMLGEPKGTFEKENMTLIIKEFIKVRMEKNINFTFKENNIGYIYDDLLGFKIVGFHGETKNMKNKLLALSKNYNVNINYLLAGHKHHYESKDIGINCGVINVPSIMGTDPYSIDKLDLMSNAGAMFLIFEDKIGKSVEKFINLNNE